jgi:hypothetical protein
MKEPADDACSSSGSSVFSHAKLQAIYSDNGVMKSFVFSDIDTSFQCYEQFAQFYQTAKGWIFDNVKIILNNWFGANMSAVLGGILDKMAGTNQISIESNNDKVLEILKRTVFFPGTVINLQLIPIIQQSLF